MEHYFLKIKRNILLNEYDVKAEFVLYLGEKAEQMFIYLKNDQLYFTNDDLKHEQIYQLKLSINLFLKWQDTEKEETYNLQSIEIDENIKQEFPNFNSFILKINNNETKFILKDSNFKVIPKEIYDYLSRYVVQETYGKTYKILKRIGKGAFANVFLVKHRYTNKKYAAKVFLKEIVQKEKKGIESIWNEMQIMAEINHPNIISLHEAFITETQIVLVMTLLTGGSLGHFLKTYQPLSENSIRKILKKILSALIYLHSKNIIHRDLKPDNLIFKRKLHEKKEQKFNICVVDLGLAQKVEEEFLFIKCGTYGYLAPEIDRAKNSKSYSELADMFSLGCIFYYLFQLVFI